MPLRGGEATEIGLARARWRARERITLLIVGIASILEVVALSSIQHLRLVSSGIMTVYDLTYVDGNLIRNIAEHARYGVCGTQIVNEWGAMCFTAHRLPLVPLVAAATAVLFTKKIFFLLLVKNLFSVLIVNAVLILPILRSGLPLRKQALALIPVALVLGSPIVINTLGQVEYEEAYSLPIFAALFGTLILEVRNDRIICRTTLASTCLVLLSLTKSTYFLVDFVFAMLWFFRNRAKPRVAALPLACLSLAIVGWGAFTYHTSGHFAFGSSMSSFNGWNLYKGNNPYTIKVYPYYLDTLDHEGLLKPEEVVRDEWELNAYYIRKTKEFMEANRLEAAQLAALKFKTLFLSYQSNGTRRGAHPSLEWFFLPAKLILQIAIGAALWLAICERELRWRGVSFLFIVSAYSLPLIVGFGYDRHLVLPSVVAAMFLSSLVAANSARSPSGAETVFSRAEQLAPTALRHGDVSSDGECGPRINADVARDVTEPMGCEDSKAWGKHRE
jgi:hypothetical protein